MPAANPPPAKASAATTPITMCVLFILFLPWSLLFVSQCFDRVEASGAHRRVEPEDDADRDGHADRDDHRAARDEKRQACRLRDAMDDFGDRPAKEDAEHASEARECDGLDEELSEDVTAPGANGLADPDLARPLVHRDEHDVHDPDPSDQQRDATDRPE